MCIQYTIVLPALTELPAALITEQRDLTAFLMCQALGFEIPCKLYKLVSFTLYCIHVELPPLDFNNQIYVKSMEMTFP